MITASPVDYHPDHEAISLLARIPDLGADMEGWSRRVGADFGIDHAEGFRQYRHPPYPTAPVLQGLLSGLVLTKV